LKFEQKSKSLHKNRTLKDFFVSLSNYSHEVRIVRILIEVRVVRTLSSQRRSGCITRRGLLVSSFISFTIKIFGSNFWVNRVYFLKNWVVNFT